ncbi:MAG: MoaD/ThiS family protein [Actinobacteria bacterium]|nr:MoaD/ThiS family protein [Actinomycetota bacterium]
MESVLIRFYAAARDAAGVRELEVLPGTLEQILVRLSQDNPRLQEVLSRCSFLIDGAICHDHGEKVLAGSRVDLLPPFAGG